MSVPTPDQLADALANAVEAFRDEPVTAEERARYRRNEVKFADLAIELCIPADVLLVAFTTALNEITGNTAIPTGPTRTLH